MLNPDLSPGATENWLEHLGDKTRLALQNMTDGEPWVLDAALGNEDAASTEQQRKVLHELSKLLTDLSAEKSEGALDDADLNDVRIIVAYLSAPRRMQVFQSLQGSAPFDSGVRLLKRSEARTGPVGQSQEDIFGNEEIEETARTILTDTVLHMLRHSSLASLFSSERVARIARIAREEQKTAKGF